jgi:guanylate kinase
MIFILPPSQKELVERMTLRGREDAEAAERRLGGSDAEIAAAWQYYEHMVINQDLEQAVKEVVEIVKHSTGEKE